MDLGNVVIMGKESKEAVERVNKWEQVYALMAFQIAAMPRWWAKHGLTYWNPRTSKAVKPDHIIRQWSDELMLGKVVKTSTIGVGQQHCAQVSVTRNEYNDILHRFFPNETMFWTLDDKGAAGQNRLCSLGDIVLIRKLAEPFTVKVTHRIESRIFEHGNVIDPISGKRIFGSEYEDLRKVRANIVKQVIGNRLTARQLAAARLSGRSVENLQQNRKS